MTRRNVRSPASEESSVEKPWLEDKRRRASDRRAYWSMLAVIGVGLAGAAALIALGIVNAMPKHKFCLVLDENFANGFDSSTWIYEQQTGGFGNHEFQYTTDSTNNTFVSTASSAGHFSVNVIRQTWTKTASPRFRSKTASSTLHLRLPLTPSEKEPCSTAATST